MGYNVSTINNLPSLSGFYFFLIGKEDDAIGMSDMALYRRFNEIAYRIGSNSAVVKSLNLENMNKELYNAFVNAPWFRDVYDEFLYRTPSLIIMQPHPKEFKFVEDEFFALIPFSTLDDVYSSEEELVRDIVALAIDGSLNIIKKVSSSSKPKSLLKRIGDAVLLQPNFSGLGVDLKELFKKEANKSTNKKAFVHYKDK